MTKDPAEVRAALILAVREHGEKRVAHEIGVARSTVSRWINDHHDPCPVHRRVLFMALTSLGAQPEQRNG